MIYTYNMAGIQIKKRKKLGMKKLKWSLEFFLFFYYEIYFAMYLNLQ